MTVHVFLGPSLSAAEARRVLPRARIRPPVRHGDLLRLSAAPGDRVLLVDGLLHGAPVGHKEILHLLDRGVAVVGAGGVGALRAAELHPYGMAGVGRVFELYRDGVLTADDEVAAVPSQEGAPAGDPLVNIRNGVERAVGTGLLTAAEGHRLIDTACALPFPARSWRRAIRRTPDLAPHTAARLADWLAAHRAEWDLVRADALAALHAVRHGLPDAGAAVRLPADGLWRTDRLAAWTLRHQGRELAGHRVPVSAEIHHAQLFDPAFPARWYAVGIRLMAGLPLDGAAVGGPGLRRAEECVLDLAADRGLTLRTLRADHTAAFLTPAERAGLGERTALLRLLVRLSGLSPGVPAVPDTDAWAAALLGDGRTAAQWAVVAAFGAEAEAAAAGRGRMLPALGASSLRAYLGAHWGLAPEDRAGLLTAARDRGFADFTGAVEAFRFFAASARHDTFSGAGSL